MARPVPPRVSVTGYVAKLDQRWPMYLAWVSWIIVCGSPLNSAGAAWNGPREGIR